MGDTPQFDIKALLTGLLAGTGLPDFAKDALLDAAVHGLLGAAARLAKRTNMTGPDFDRAAASARAAQGF